MYAYMNALILRSACMHMSICMLIRIYTQMYTYMNALILRSVCIHPPQHWHPSSSESYTKRPHKPAGDVELPGHVEHAAGPGESLNLPSSHAVHVPPLGPVYPAMHAQSSVASLAAFTCAQMHTHTHTHTCYASCALHARLAVNAFMHMYI